MTRITEHLSSWQLCRKFTDISYMDGDWCMRMAHLEDGCDVSAGAPEKRRSFQSAKSRLRFDTYLTLMQHLLTQAQRAQREDMVVELVFKPRYSDSTFKSHAYAEEDLDKVCEEAAQKHHVCASWHLDENTETYEILFLPRDE